MKQEYWRRNAYFVLVAMLVGLASCNGSSSAGPGLGALDPADGGSGALDPVGGGPGTLDGGSGAADSGTTASIGGNVSGLAAGTSVVLLNGGNDALTIEANGKYVFATRVASGSAYDVSIGQQPAGRTCTVSHARDTVASSDVTDVNVACVEQRAVGGSITGMLPFMSITLQNNGGDALTLTADGPFTFATNVPDGALYSVTVSALSVGLAAVPIEICPVTNGTGTVSGSAVTNVAVNCPGPAYKPLYSFTGGTDGGTPLGDLAVDANGDLYGTTSEGGAANAGTVFKISVDGTGYTQLFSFSGGADGKEPVAGLVLDGAGNLYGTTRRGGANKWGTVFKLAPSGAGKYTESVLHSFAGGTDGETPMAALMLDGKGNLFGTTLFGGGVGNAADGTVFRLSTDGTGYGVVHLFGDTTEGYPLARLVQDASGNLYGTSLGGGGGSGSVFKLTPDGSGGYVGKMLHKFIGGANGARPMAGLVLDAGGNLFGTTSGGGTDDHGTVFEIAYNGFGGYNYRVLHAFDYGDGYGPEGALVLNQSTGELYGTTASGASPGGGSLFRLYPDGTGNYIKFVRYIFGSQFVNDGSSPTTGLTMDANGVLYGVTPYGGAKNLGTIFRLSP